MLWRPNRMTISLHNRQRAVRLDLPWLRRFAAIALPECAEVSADGRWALRGIAEVEVALVSDRVIDRVHREFMGIAGATDVITFRHGEIVISAETARARAPEFGHAAEEEIALYTVHGLLHLNGFEDAASRDAARMRKAQDRIWRACLQRLPKPKLE
jgi:probable rRNA maturation factor